MNDDRINYSFYYYHPDGSSTEMSFIDSRGGHYKEIADKFFSFLSTVYGYPITAEDVLNEDSGNS